MIRTADTCDAALLAELNEEVQNLHHFHLHRMELRLE